MKMTHIKKLMSFILCMVLIVAIALGTTGCNDNTGKDTSTGMRTEINSQTDGSETNTQADVNVLGTGSTKFSMAVTDKEGNETFFEINTDKETVGDALLECGLIDGEEGEFGLYVKTVNGITADYDTDGTYWAFYINDEYASSGVDSTVITEGENYAFKVE